MDTRDIGVIFLLEEGWRKHLAGDNASARVMFSQAFDNMKSLAIEANNIEKSRKGDLVDYFDDLHSYNKLTRRQLYALLFCRGLTEFEDDQFDEARYFFALCKQFEPSNPLAYIYSCLSYSKQGHDAAAFDEIYTALHERQAQDLSNSSIDIISAELYCVLAVLHHRRNDMISAVKNADTALRLHTRCVMALIIKGDSITLQRNSSLTPDGLQCYKLALRMDRKNAAKFIGLGFLGVEGWDWVHHFLSIFTFYSVIYATVKIDGEWFKRMQEYEQMQTAFDSFRALFANDWQLGDLSLDSSRTTHVDSAFNVFVQNKRSPRDMQQEGHHQPRDQAAAVATAGSTPSNKKAHVPPLLPTSVAPTRNYDKPWLVTTQKRSSSQRQQRQPVKRPVSHRTAIKPERNYEKPWLANKQAQLARQQTRGANLTNHKAKAHFYQGKTNQLLYSSIHVHKGGVRTIQRSKTPVRGAIIEMEENEAEELERELMHRATITISSTPSSNAPSRPSSRLDQQPSPYYAMSEMEDTRQFGHVLLRRHASSPTSVSPTVRQHLPQRPQSASRLQEVDRSVLEQMVVLDKSKIAQRVSKPATSLNVQGHQVRVSTQSRPSSAQSHHYYEDSFSYRSNGSVNSTSWPSTPNSSRPSSAQRKKKRPSSAKSTTLESTLDQDELRSHLGPFTVNSVPIPSNSPQADGNSPLNTFGPIQGSAFTRSDQQVVGMQGSASQGGKIEEG